MHTHYTHPMTHKAGHIQTPADDCDVCNQVFLKRQRDIFAAARLVRDSEHLRYMTPGFDDRAEIALRYVQNEGAEYADAARFDDAYAGVWGDFDEFVQNLVNDLGMLDGVPETLARYFDYDAFGRDLLLGGDYYTIDISGLRVLVMSNN